MSMTMSAEPAAAPAPQFLPRAALIALAAINTLGALASMSAIFQDYGHTTPLLIFAQTVTKAQLAVAPFIAGAALVFAIRNQLRRAIVALAALLLLHWAADLPSIAIHGLEFSANAGALFIVLQRLVYPAIAIAAIVLSRQDRNLPLAAALLALPLVVLVAGVAAFAIGVSIHGF